MNYLLLMAVLIATSCSALKKDNDPKNPTHTAEEIAAKRDVYLSLGTHSLDSLGLVLMSGSMGDSALFSCLAYNAGLTDFDPTILWTPDGRPVRHPFVYSNISEWESNQCKSQEGKSDCTPISKDMVNGHLWCLYSLGKKDKEKAKEIVEKMISYGRGHRYGTTWDFCTKEERKNWHITSEDYLGKCVMTPAVVKDVYRVAISLGYDCDAQCKVTMSAGVNIPSEPTGFGRHLAALTTVRNGLVDGAINDNSLDQLKTFAEKEPRNGLYSAAYHLFYDGDFVHTYGLLADVSLFPRENLPSTSNYCTDYLYQRDERRNEDLEVVDGCIKYFEPDTKEYVKECGHDGASEVQKYVYNADWLSCEGDHLHSGLDYLFASTLALGLLN